jgi:hypothetical protein
MITRISQTSDKEEEPARPCGKIKEFQWSHSIAGKKW